MAEPILIVVPNAEALELLKEIVGTTPHPEFGEAVWETEITLRITADDVRRFMYEQRDLVQIGIYLGEDGTAEGFSYPDQGPQIGPFFD